jgi:hypothetical protein
MIALVAFLLWTPILAEEPDKSKPTTAPLQPALTVVLDHSDLVAGRALAAHIWVVNPTDAHLGDMHVRLSAPSYLQLGHANGDKCEVLLGAPAQVALPDLGPHTAYLSPIELCLQARETVEEADITIALSLSYTQQSSASQGTGLVVSEKKLSIGLFGTETVAGTSLRLAAYFIPGLIFVILLRLARLPWFDRGGAEGTALIVVFSVALSLLAGWIFRIGHLSGLELGGGINALFFLLLCVIAAGIALILAFVSYLWTRLQRICRARIKVGANDPLDIVMLKALRIAPKGYPTVTVVTKKDQRFVGSLMADMDDGGTVLLGWFLRRAHPPARSTRISW